MIHRPRLCHNLLKWLLAYLRGRKVSCLYQQHHSPSRQVRSAITSLSHLPTLFNNFQLNCKTPDLDMTSYSDDFTLLASDPSIVEAETRANQLCSSLVRWADSKQRAIAAQKSSMTLFISDTHQSRFHPQVRIETRWPRWTESLKSWVSRWTPTSPLANTPAIVSSVFRELLTSWKP